MKTKVVVLSSGALIALLLLARYFALSQRPLPLSQPTVPISERLEELEALHANGAISDTEYRARRLQVISET